MGKLGLGKSVVTDCRRTSLVSKLGKQFLGGRKTPSPSLMITGFRPASSAIPGSRFRVYSHIIYDGDKVGSLFVVMIYGAASQ